MSWKKEQGQKLREFGSLIITLVLDGLLVLAVAVITELIRYVIEHYIIKCKIEASGNHELKYVFFISQVILISAITIYALVDIIRHIISAFKKIKGGDE